MAKKTKKGFNILEVILVIALVGAIAIIVVPRIQQANLASRESSCFSNVKRIDKQVELWQATRGSLPADITQIGADPGFFPEGIPLCPVSDAAYFLDASFRVAQHLNGNHTPVPGVLPPPPPPPGGPFITWAWGDFVINDGLDTFGNVAISGQTIAMTIEDAGFTESDFAIEVADMDAEDYEGDARLLYGAGNSSAVAIQELEGGGYIAIGYMDFSGAGDCDTWLVRFDEEGVVMWAKTYGTAGREDGYGVQQTIDGGFVMVGRYESTPGAPADISVIKVDGNGNLVDNEGNSVGWSKRYGGEGTDQALSIIQTSDHGYVITGHTETGGAGFWENPNVIKLDSNGNMSWSKVLGGNDPGLAASVLENANGDIVITGNMWQSDFSTINGFMVKMDASTGDLLWGGNKKEYRHSSYSSVGCAVETFDGNYVLAGSTNYKGSLTKTDSEGNELWTYAYDEARFLNYVQETADGGYIMVGGDDGGFQENTSLVKVNSDGEVEWTKKYSGDRMDRATYVWQTADGGYVLGGATSSFNESDGHWAFFTIKTDDKGNVLFDE